MTRYALAFLFLVFGPGCAVSVRPDTLCQLPRPSASLRDSPQTIAAQKKAAATWDSRCTLAGMLTRW